MKNFTQVEQCIMAWQSLPLETRQAELAEANTLTLKRKLSDLYVVNKAQPDRQAINELLHSYAYAGQARWLELERNTLALDMVSIIQPSLYTVLDHNKLRLQLNNIACSQWLSVGTKIGLKSPPTQYSDTDFAKPQQFDKNVKFDLISSICSINRFFRDKESAKQVFKNMAACLSDEGHIVIVFRDGGELLPPTKKPCNHREGDRECVFKHPASFVVPNNKPCVENYYGTLAPSHQKMSVDTPVEEIKNAYCIEPHQQDEYLVFRKVLIGIAAYYGLVPVTTYSAEIHKHFIPNKEPSPFHRFIGTCYLSVVLKKKK